MFIDESIPGWTCVEKLESLATYANFLTRNSSILQIGGELGRGTVAIGRNKPKNCFMLVINPIFEEYQLDCHYGKKGMLCTRNNYERNIVNIENIVSIYEYVNEQILYKFNRTYDMIYIENANDSSEINRVLELTYPYLATEGIFFINDYTPYFAESVLAIDNFCEKYNLYLEKIEKVPTKDLVMVHEKFWE